MYRVGLLIAASAGWTACGFSVSAQPDGPSPDLATDMAATSCAAAEVRASGDHTCARTSNGELYCWGRAENGELGSSPGATTCATPSQACSATPKVVAIPSVTAFGTGTYHGCAATTAGTYCWGFNGLGQYGDGGMTDAIPTKIVAQRLGASMFDGGIFHTCSLSSGHVSCSGKNDAGEVGNNTLGTPQLTAVDVMSDVTALATGAYSSCAIDGNHDVFCWGRNSYKQIDATQLDRRVPTKVVAVSNAAAIASGTDHVCIAHPDKTATCWGSNTVGQLGNGLTTGSPQAPVNVAAANIVDVSAELYHTCVLDAAGAVWCFGEGYTPTPVKIALAAPAVTITTGGHHDCAVTAGGALYCWGDQTFGQLGNGVTMATRATTPQRVTLCP